MPELDITVLLGPQERLVQVEAEIDAVFRFTHQLYLLPVFLFLTPVGRDAVQNGTCRDDSFTVSVDVFSL